MVRVDWAIEKENEPFKQTQTKRSSFTQHTAAVCSFCMFMKWFCSIEWLMGVRSQWCVSFPLKPTPLSRATGQDGGGGEDGQAGRQTDGWPLPPPPNPNSQAATNQTQRRRRATTPTVLWLALMGLNLQQKVVAWLSIAFFCSLVLIEGGGEGDWRKMRGTREGGGGKITGGQEVFK